MCRCQCVLRWLVRLVMGQMWLVMGQIESRDGCRMFFWFIPARLVVSGESAPVASQETLEPMVQQLKAQGHGPPARQLQSAKAVATWRW